MSYQVKVPPLQPKFVHVQCIHVAGSSLRICYHRFDLYFHEVPWLVLKGGRKPMNGDLQAGGKLHFPLKVDPSAKWEQCVWLSCTSGSAWCSQNLHTIFLKGKAERKADTFRNSECLTRFCSPWIHVGDDLIYPVSRGECLGSTGFSQQAKVLCPETRSTLPIIKTLGRCVGMLRCLASPFSHVLLPCFWLFVYPGFCLGPSSLWTPRYTSLGLWKTPHSPHSLKNFMDFLTIGFRMGSSCTGEDPAWVTPVQC